MPKFLLFCSQVSFTYRSSVREALSLISWSKKWQLFTKSKIIGENFPQNRSTFGLGCPVHIQILAITNILLRRDRINLADYYTSALMNKKYVCTVNVWIHTEWPKSKLCQNSNGREFRFQATFWSFKPNKTSSDWFIALDRVQFQIF